LNRKRHPLTALLISLVLLSQFPHIALAHAPAELDPSKTIRAVRVDAQEPRIDGQLDDEIWSRAPEYNRFTQQIPDDGKPATEKTIVQFAYDEDALYVAMTLYYSDPDQITDNLTRRDQTYDADRFRVEIDTHHDHQTAYMFELTAAGVQRDAHVTKNGDGFDGNWDAVWESSVARHEGYLAAEWRIPYQALRFSPAEEYTWGINIVRSIAQKHEMVYWSRIPRQERGWVSRFGHLVGIKGISPARALEILPYAVGRSIFYPGGSQDTDLTARAGADVRYGLSHSTSLNATINPDFGQVEADPAELNLTTFETFQSERRPFFVEGAQMFRTPIDLFYSRRIGRRPGYLPVEDWGEDEIDRPDATTVLGAVKLTGKTSGQTTFGLMEAVTAEEYATLDVSRAQDRIDWTGGDAPRALIEPRTNYLAGRVIQDVLRNSHVGILGTALHRDHGDNAYSGGIDWKLNTDKNDYEFVGQIVASTANSRNGWGTDVEIGKRTGRWRAEANLQAFSPDLTLNDMGFLRRSDIVESALELEFRNNDPWRAFRYNSFWIDGARRWNFDDVVLEENIGAGFWNQFLFYWSFGAGANHTFRARDDRDTRGGPLIATPASNNYWASIENDWRQPYSYWINFNWGSDSAGGTQRRLRGGVSLKPSSWLEVNLRPSYSWNFDNAQWIKNIDSDGSGSVDSYIYGQLESKTLDLTTRANIIFNPHLSLEIYLQPFVTAGDYKNLKELAAPGTYRFTSWLAPIDNPDFRRRSLRSNVVLRWEYRPGSTLFLVWSQNRSDSSDDARLRPLHNLGDSFADDGTNVLFLKTTFWSNP